MNENEAIEALNLLEGDIRNPSTKTQAIETLRDYLGSVHNEINMAYHKGYADGYHGVRVGEKEILNTLICFECHIQPETHWHGSDKLWKTMCPQCKKKSEDKIRENSIAVWNKTNMTEET